MQLKSVNLAVVVDNTVLGNGNKVEKWKMEIKNCKVLEIQAKMVKLYGKSVGVC